MAAPKTKRDEHEADAIIVGGGLVGLASGLALGQAGLSTIIVDALPAEHRLAASFDGRASAVAYANYRMLRVLGVADRIGSEAQRIEDILVSDGRAPDGLRAGGPGPFALWFDRRERDAASDGEPLGYMVENRRMRLALLETIAQSDAVRHLAPANAVSADLAGARARLTLADGRALTAPLLIGAEGRRSVVREAARIRTVGWSYPQDGLVATVRMERDHGGVAHEYFLPSGPFAILPLTERRASLVWTERRAAARAAMALNEAAFEAEIQRRFGDFLGEARLEGPRWSFPLELQIAERFFAPRAALVGDAARRIHPIAGQGFNLGLKDAAALAELAGEAVTLGLDPGGPDVLLRYQQWRRPDSVLMALATDAFNRLFSTDAGPVRLVRGLGLAAVGRIAAARRLFMRDAGADLGALPKLLQGRRLDGPA